jgi:O-antigen ligase
MKKVFALVLAAVIFTAPLRWRLTLYSQDYAPVYPDFTDIMIYASTITAFAAIFFASCISFLNKEFVSFLRHISHRKLLVSWFAISLLIITNTAISIAPAVTLFHWAQLVFLATAGGMVTIILNSDPFDETHTNAKNWVQIGLMLMVAINSLVGIAQVWLQHSIGLSWLGELILDPVWRGMSVLILGDMRFLRGYGLTDHPNILGGALAMALIALVICPHKRTNASQILNVLIFALGCAALCLTFSRAAWLALMIGLVVLLLKGYFRHHHQKLIFMQIGIAVGVITISATLPQFFSRLDTTSNPVAAAGQLERGYINAKAMELFIEHFIFGTGLGTSPIAFKESYPAFPLSYQPAHIVILVLADELGVFGVIGYAVFVGFGLWRLRSKNAIALLVAFVAIGVLDHYPLTSAWGKVWHGVVFGEIVYHHLRPKFIFSFFR